ncbi:MAG: pyridoxal phosphate-dependent decarboxylase family protein [Rhodospirillales bacterium]
MSKYTDDFRRAGREAVDWVAGYLENTRQYPVLPKIKPGELIDALPASGPEKGESLEAILKDFRELIVPATTLWNHPRFMAYFPSASSPPAILAEMLAAALNTNAIHWKTSPASTELEQVALGWLRQWMGLPKEFFGVIFDTASVSSMHAIAAAREMADPEARENGMRPGMVLYASDQAHSSIEKDSIALGIGRRNLRKIESDSEFRMRTDLLEAAIERDLAAGKRPFCIVATIGTTSTTSIDPVSRIAEIAERYGLWLHVDAAYAGAAMVVPELRPLFDGVERAHSLVTNAHKWMFMPMDISMFFTRRPDILRRAFSLVPEYLRTAEHPRAVNLMDYGVPLGRRFRSLKLWFALRYFGREGIVEVLRSHVSWAAEFASWVDADPRFERVAPAPLSAVCFRYKGTDEENRAIIDCVNASGKFFLSHTVLNGKFVARLAIGNLYTTRQDVEEAWELIRSTAPR